MKELFSRDEVIEMLATVGLTKEVLIDYETSKGYSKVDIFLAREQDVSEWASEPWGSQESKDLRKFIAWYREPARYSIVDLQEVAESLSEALDSGEVFDDMDYEDYTKEQIEEQTERIKMYLDLVINSSYTHLTWDW